jgi:hypothetical protein
MVTISLLLEILRWIHLIGTEQSNLLHYFLLHSFVHSEV